MSWAQKVRSEIERAAFDKSSEGQAKAWLETLPARAYDAKRTNQPHVKVIRLYLWDETKSLADLSGTVKLIADELIKEGFSPFIFKYEDRMDGGSMYEYHLCLPV